MISYSNTITDANGVVISGASVEVLESDGVTQSTIYSDDGVTQASNPLTTAADGTFSFYVTVGTYTLSISATGQPSKIVHNVKIGNENSLTTFPSGTEALPGLAAESDLDLGFYLSAQSVLGLSVAGSHVALWDTDGYNGAIGQTTPAAGNFSTVDIDGGTIDGTAIGNTTAAAFRSLGIDDNASSNVQTIDSSGNTLFKGYVNVNRATITSHPFYAVGDSANTDLIIDSGGNTGYNYLRAGTANRFYVAGGEFMKITQYGMFVGNDTFGTLPANPPNAVIGDWQGSLYVCNNQIGTNYNPDSDAEQIVVENNSTCGISVISANGSLASYYMGSPANPAGGVISWDYTNSRLRIDTNEIINGGIGSIELRSGVNQVALTCDKDQNVLIGPGSLATTATDGFLYIPACEGTPTGVATTKTGFAALVYDSINAILYVYDEVGSGGWLGVAVT